MRHVTVRDIRIRALATVGVAAFALAACGSSSKSGSPATTASSAPATTVASASTTAPAPTPAPGASASVTVATTKIGKVVVNAKGLTLYRFDNDTTAGKSTCDAGPCASTWPAVTVSGTPTPGAGIDASKLTTFTRADGKTQLQLDGHPLYTFAGDTKAGDTAGEGIGGKWYAVGPTGAKVS